MRSSASTPAFALLDDARRSAQQRAHASLNRSQSLLAPRCESSASNRFAAIVQSTPFMAVPGLSQRVKTFSRAYSIANLDRASTQSQYGSSSVSRRAPSIGALRSDPFSQSYSDLDSDYDNDSTSVSRRDQLMHDTSSDSLMMMGDDDDVIPDEQLNPPLTLSLILAVACAVLSSFQNGFNSGLLNVPQSVIMTSLALTDTQWSIVVSIFCVGGLIGCIIGGWAADRLGRKNFLVTNNVCFILGCLLQALATNIYMLVIGRLIVGVGCGSATVVVPLYLGEISPANLRGSLGTMNQFATVIGILIANLLGKPLGGTDEWRFLLGIVLVPSLVQIVLSSFLLESPLWLIVTGGNKGLIQAESILIALRGTENVDFDLETMIHHREQTTTSTRADAHTDNGSGSDSEGVWSTVSKLTSRVHRRPLIVGFLLQVSQQFSGINAVFFYSTAFFISANVNDPWLGSVACSAVNVLAVWLALNLMDRVGRKTLLLTSTIGMALSAIALTYFLAVNAQHANGIGSGSEALMLGQHDKHGSDSDSEAIISNNLSTTSPFYGYLSIVFVLLFVTFFEIGLGPIPWLIGVEIYPAPFRGLGISLGSSINWIANFAVSLAFPHINNMLGSYAFLPFTFALVLSAAFITTAVPETRGKSLEEIQTEMTGVYTGVDEASDENEFERLATNVSSRKKASWTEN